MGKACPRESGGGHLAADLAEVMVHRGGIADRHDQRRRLALRRADRTPYLAMHLEGHLAELDINPLMVLPISRARSSMASTRSITLPTRSPASAVHLRPPHC